MTTVHLHLLLNHVPVVGTLFAFMGWTANLGGQIRYSEIRSANFQQDGSGSDD